MSGQIPQLDVMRSDDNGRVAADPGVNVYYGACGCGSWG